ncbi:MAG: preprotein translocase subunit YajC [Ruminococcus sp.]|nr:preprotein translocase subunit YajC [Ruminococcus sp.]
MNLSAYAAVLTASGSTPTAAGYAATFLPLILVVVFFYFFIMRPQKKQEKKDAEMRDSLEIGDEVVTNGGIVGIVCQIKEDTVVIETGGDRSKIRIKKWAIAKNETIHDDQ